MDISNTEKVEELEEDEHELDGLVDIAINITNVNNEEEKATEQQRDIEMSNVLRSRS